MVNNRFFTADGLLLAYWNFDLNQFAINLAATNDDEGTGHMYWLRSAPSVPALEKIAVLHMR